MRKIMAILVLICLYTQPLIILAAETPSAIPFSNLENTIDEFIAQHLKQTAPGIAVAVVKNGEIIFSKGYGYADIDMKNPVDPATTVFEYGSISKTLVWVAVMQLVEQGRLDLDTDITAYLPEDLNRRLNFNYPITMRNLMNHDAGFVNNLFDMMLDVNRVEPSGSLQNAIISAQPKQIYEPGTTSAYSNFGTALAAIAVESITGQAYSAYEKEYIINPCDMANTLNQPDWVNNQLFLQAKATGYLPVVEGGFSKDIWSYVPMYPAGAINGTAEDLAQFAIALTPPQNTSGPLFGKSDTLSMIFTPSVLDSIHRPGTHHGFMRYDGALPAFGHGGNSAAFNSYFAVVPEERFGIVVLTNAAAAYDITLGMADLLLGSTIKQVTSVTENLPSAINVEGHFIMAQRFEGFIEEIVSYLALSQVIAINDNTIALSYNGQYTATYLQTEPYVYRIISSDNYFMNALCNELRFKMEEGRPVQIIIGNGFDLTSLPPNRTIPFLIASGVIAISSIVFFLLIPVVLLVGYILNRKKERKNKPFHLASAGFMLCGTLFILNFITYVVRAISLNFWATTIEMMPHIWINYGLLFVTILLLIGSLLALRMGEIGIKRKSLYITSIPFMALLIVTLFNWNFFVLR